MSRKPLEWKKTGTLEAMVEWIRRDGECLAVVAIRVNDAAFATDPLVPAADVGALLLLNVPKLVAAVKVAHGQKKSTGRLVFEPMED